MPASPQRTGRMRKGPLDPGTRQGMYVAFVKNAMLQKTKGELGPYQELLAQFQSGATDTRSSNTQLQPWLTALSHVAPSLDRSCAELADAVLEFPWLSLPSHEADAWVRFVCALVSARSEWVSKLAGLLFSNFALSPPWYRDAFVGDEAPRPTRRQLYDRLHTLLQHLLRLIPTLPSTLQAQILRHFPHKRDRTLAQVLYIRNLLWLTEYCEALTEPIWSAIVDHMLQVDVEIQVELDELEDQGVEPTGIATLSNILDGGMDEEAEEEGEADQSGAASPPKDDSEDLDALEDLDEEDGYEMNDSLLPAHPTEHEPAWNEIAVLAGKLDAIMKAVFDFLANHVGHGTGRSHPTVDVRRYQLYQTLLGIFTRSVLTTFKSRHVQFLLFWYASLDTEFADMFLGTLLSKSLYAPGANAEAASSDSATFMRIAAASYVASYVARAKYIDGSTTRMVLLNLCTYLDACLEAFAQQGRAAPAPGAREHAMFYAVAQAVFYIFCFRWRDLRLGSSATIESSSHDDDAPSLAQTYPTACSLELSPQLLPTLHGASFSSAGSSTSGLTAEAGWAPGLAVVQRAITSPLNPLRYCNGNVVQQFAHVAQHTGFLYCYSILDANARRASHEASAPPAPSTASTASGASSAPGTPQRSSRTRASRESTPLAVPQGDAPVPVPAKALDVFFPFDPYRLRDSGPMVHPLYREWSDVAPEGEEEEDEDHADAIEPDDDVDDEMGALPANRTKLSAMVGGVRGHLSSSNDPSITPESVAQSLEAMSISPYTG